MDSTLKLDKNDMQSLEARERDRERRRRRGGGHSIYALEHNDAGSDTVNKVDLDCESMPGSRCRS